MKLTNYKVVDSKTDTERFTDGSDCVVIAWDGEAKTIRTFTSGSQDCMYEGGSMGAARESLELSNDQWDLLLRRPVEYLEII